MLLIGYSDEKTEDMEYTVDKLLVALYVFDSDSSFGLKAIRISGNSFTV